MSVPEFLAHEEGYHFDQFFCNCAFRATFVWFRRMLLLLIVQDLVMHQVPSLLYLSLSLIGSLSFDFSE